MTVERGGTEFRLSSKGRALLALCMAGFLLVGCTLVGPRAIRSGRLAYNEAITETNNQQMLMVPVRNRYTEDSDLLTVASVTANVRISSRAQVEAGFGDADNYEGNLVPFRGGFVYEENPTISYIPVTGEKYLKQLTSPVPLALLARVAESFHYPDFVYYTLVSSVNGIRNPAFLYDSQQDDPRFDRFVALMIGLTRHHALHWIHDPEDVNSVSLVIDLSNSQTAGPADELMNLLGLSGADQNGERLVVPIALALDGDDTGGIGITTRTTLDLLEILSGAVEVPAQHERSGVAAPFPRPGSVGRDLAIHYSESKPKEAYVMVEYREGWYYIDARDQATKRYFKLLGNLWSTAMAQTMGTTSSTPILTVPVSR